MPEFDSIIIKIGKTIMAKLHTHVEATPRGSKPAEGGELSLHDIEGNPALSLFVRHQGGALASTGAYIGLSAGLGPKPKLVERIVLAAATSSVSCLSPFAKPVATLSGQGDLTLGGGEFLREVLVGSTPGGKPGVGGLDTPLKTLSLQSGVNGEIHCKNDHGVETVLIRGGSGDITLGAGPPPLEQHPGMPIGMPKGVDGGLYCKNKTGVETVRIDGATGGITLGNQGVSGEIWCKNDKNDITVQLLGQTGDLILGGNAANGYLACKNDKNEITVELKGQGGDLILGGNATNGYLACKNDKNEITVELLGQAGDVRLAGADCAEYVRVQDAAGVDPGTVLIATEDRGFVVSDTAYDRRVVGVVSGAGNFRPGIRLNLAEASTGVPLALTGRVVCKVDATYGAIRVGDLLVTSPTPGHAMRADDRARTFGAIIGKALAGQAGGKGAIVVLVALA